MGLLKSSQSRTGFTVIEILVAVGLFAILMGLLLPAVMSIRASARRVQCAANLRQMGIALHGYIDTWRALPPVMSWGESQTAPRLGRVYSSQSLTLALIEPTTYNAINFSLPGLALTRIDPGNATAANQQIDSFMCPDDASARGAQPARINYRANDGLCDGCDERNRGAFIWGRVGSLADFRDGISNTVAYSEKLSGSTPPGQYHGQRDWIEYFVQQPAASHVRQWITTCETLKATSVSYAVYDAGGTWLLGGAVYTNFFVSVPPNSSIPDCGMRSFGGLGVYAARSHHIGGVNAAFSDGAVKWVASSIDARVWQALGTRNGGEF